MAFMVALLIVLVNFLDARNLGIWEAAPPLGGREAARGMPEFRDSKKTSTTGIVILFHCYIAFAWQFVPCGRTKTHFPMDKRRILLFMLFGMLFQTAFAQTSPYHPQELLLKLKPGLAFSITEGSADTGLPAIDALSKELGAVAVEQFVRSKPRDVRRQRPDTRLLLLLRFEKEIDVERAVELYRATGLVQYAEPNYIGQGGGVQGLVPDDAFYSRQWGLKNDGTFNAGSVAGADINIEPAWEITQGNPNLAIAILDSGTRLGHPEFAGRIWQNGAEVPGNGMDDDQNGYIDDVQAWDFVNNDNLPADDHGHGANVSGIMAATGNNGIGYAGVDWNSRVMICKILNDQNNGLYSWWTEAIYYAVDNGASVINMSVGGSGYSASMEEAVNYAHANDAAVVACMMNTNESQPFYPAAYANTIAVGATDTDDRRVAPFFWSATSGSNYGPHIDLVAPGNYIYGLDEASDVNYNSYWGGTSQASPMVAGVAALLKGLMPGLDVETIRTILRTTADDQVGNPAEDTPGWDIYYGAGRLNAFNALEYLQNMVGAEQGQTAWGTVQVYPNPTPFGENPTLEVQLAHPQEVQLTVWNSLGQLLFSDSFRLEERSLLPIPVDLPTGLNGLYLQGKNGAGVGLRLLVE